MGSGSGIYGGFNKDKAVLVFMLDVIILAFCYVRSDRLMGLKFGSGIIFLMNSGKRLNWSAIAWRILLVIFSKKDYNIINYLQINS